MCLHTMDALSKFVLETLEKGLKTPIVGGRPTSEDDVYIYCFIGSKWKQVFRYIKLLHKLINALMMINYLQTNVPIGAWKFNVKPF